MTESNRKSVGALLASTRESKGIAVERAAKDTRIRVGRIRDMEDEDFSRFTNPSYARMFLIAYAKYLGISSEEIQDYLPEPGQSGSDGYAYIHARSQDLPSLRPVAAGQQRMGRSRLLPALVLVLVLVVVLLGGAVWLYLSTNLPRLAVSEATIPESPVPDVVAVVPELANLPDPDAGGKISDDPFARPIGFAETPAAATTGTDPEFFDDQGFNLDPSAHDESLPDLPAELPADDESSPEIDGVEESNPDVPQP